MPLVEGPAVELARRLRALRESRWPNLNITQAQLSEALAVSVPSISSWENPENPAVPPVLRIEAYATFFAADRSVATSPFRLPNLAELTAAEKTAREQLLDELIELREAAKSGASPSAPRHRDSLLRFPPGQDILVVCAPLPAELRQTMPNPDPLDPDHSDLYNYADIDALIELYGRLNALNPDSTIRRARSDNLTAGHYTNHLIMLGGVDWNTTLRDLVPRTSVPVRQIARDQWADLGRFEVDEVGSNQQPLSFEPLTLEFEGSRQLAEDVAQIYYGPSPYNQERTVIQFNGQFARGTLGAVKALTDRRFRDRNEAYLRDRFADEPEWTLLTRVVIADGKPVTPIWTIEDSRLYEWPAQRNRPRQALHG